MLANKNSVGAGERDESRIAEVAVIYEKLAKAFEADVATMLRRSEKRAWWVAAGSLLVVCIMGVALAGLTPLHRIEPFVVRVDNATGAVDAVSRLNEGTHTESEAVDKYMAAKYVRAREGYSRELAPVNYKTVALMSAAPVAQIYHDAFKPDNPKSPLRMYGGNGTIMVRIVNVSFVAPQVAAIVYEKTVRDSGAATRSMWRATITYRYSNAPMSEDDRLVNPAGFEVTDYRNDPEVVGGQ